MAHKSLKFRGRTLTIKPYYKGAELTKFRESLLQKRLFVKRIPSFWTDVDLLNFFKAYGEIDSAYIVYDKATKKSRQFGYVVTASVELADTLAGIGTFERKDGQLIVQKHQE